MRAQFSYQYKSYMENKHGFFTFMPTGKLFHPYFGFKTLGVWFFNDSTDTLDIVKEFEKFDKHFNHKTTFSHKVKLYFPEIRKGVICIDKVNYSVDAHPDDNVSLSYKNNSHSKYKDYIEIEHHIAEIDITIELTYKYKSPIHPVTIKCNYIDLLLFEQRISITETINSIHIVPYVYARHTDTPFSFVEHTKAVTSSMSNNSLTYTVGINKESADYIKKHNGTVSSVIIQPENIFTDEPKVMYEFTLGAFVSNYSMDRKDRYDKKNITPIINSDLFYGSKNICRNLLGSDWYVEIYNIDPVTAFIPSVECKDAKTHISYTEVRDEVLKKICLLIDSSDSKLSDMFESEGYNGNHIVTKKAYEMYKDYKPDFTSQLVFSNFQKQFNSL